MKPVIFSNVLSHCVIKPLILSPPSVQPHVRVWESINLTTLHVIGEKEFQRGVSCVSFSPVSHTHSVLVISLQVTYQQNLK